MQALAGVTSLTTGRDRDPEVHWPFRDVYVPTSNDPPSAGRISTPGPEVAEEGRATRTPPRTLLGPATGTDEPMLS